MNLNPAAILALIADLYGQVTKLGEDNQQLRAALAQSQARTDDLASSDAHDPPPQSS